MRIQADDERQRIIEWIRHVKVATTPRTDAAGKIDRTRERYEGDEDVDKTQVAMERHADELQEETAYNDCLRGLHDMICNTLHEVEDMDIDTLRETANDIFSDGLSSRQQRIGHRLESHSGAKARGLRKALSTLQDLENEFLLELSDWEL